MRPSKTMLMLFAREISLASLLPLAVACGGKPPPASPAKTETAAAKPTSAEGPALPDTVAALAKGAMLFDGLGGFHRTVSTASPEAQKYFDQGLRLSYGFNHDEATRSFAKAATLDDECAMCFWGAAYTMGPNYNVPMLPDRAKAAWDALRRAQALVTKDKVTPVEAALIGALGKRYKGPEALDAAAMEPYSRAYAAAMRDVSKRFDDLDVQVLWAEAAMDTMPWKLWSLGGEPGEGTLEIVATLENALERDANHPGANHFYIHAVEASSHPERALPSAERLAGLMPNAGHVVHMPAHIFQRVGRYADASAANENAAHVDEAYLKQTTAPGYYPMYLGHNYGFLAFSASMEGRSLVALDAARRSAKAMPPEMVDMMPGMDFFVSEPLLAMVRFGKWDDLLAEPRPDAKYPVLTALWLHGHGMALAAKGKLDDARADLKELAAVGAAAPAGVTAGQNDAKDVFAVAAKILEARIATLEANASNKKASKKDSLALWAEAVALADKLAYSEPDDWFYPVRHLQGAALMSAGKAAEAEAVYRKDLAMHPHNGWALFGLKQALGAQGKNGAELKAVKEELAKVWAKADVKLTASAF